MEVIRKDVSDFFPTSHVRLLMVQLRSAFAGTRPELRYSNESHAFRSDSKSAAARTRRARLRVLMAELTHSELSPQLIVLPEYSIPRDSHEVLLAYAKERTAIVVGGSYYDEEPQSDTFRMNICPIFFPDGTTLAIYKQQLFRDEHRAVRPATGNPSIARLSWKADATKRFSIDVYLCLDYLHPFTVVNGTHVSLRNWNDHGLSVVVMNSRRTRLFIGQAAIEVRELRGPGKFVALCNASYPKPDPLGCDGSTLLGPTDEFRAGNDDIVAQLPGDIEGTIFAEVDLSSVTVVTKRPQRRTHDPVKRVLRQRLLEVEEPPMLREISAEAYRRERGVWHPAFLDVIKRNIVLKLLTANDATAAVDAFSGDQSNWMTVASIRGQHDFLVSFYAEHGREDAFPMPYWLAGSARLEEWFDSKRQTTLIVRPKKIFKFRDARIPDGRSSDWASARRKIQELIPKNESARREFIRLACRLARDWNCIEPEQREKLRPLFMDQIETTPVLEEIPGSCRRQTFVLVTIMSRQTGDFETFKREIVQTWLCSVPEVRSIFEVEISADEPDVTWNYWLDIVADPQRTDDIVASLFERCVPPEIRIGTRSMDRTRYLKLRSVEGLQESDALSEIVSFLEDPDLSALWGERGLDLDTQRLTDRRHSVTRIAGTYREHISDVEEWIERSIRNRLVEFYGWWFCGNVCRALETRETRLLEAASAGFSIYRAVEVAAKRMLEHREGADFKKTVLKRLEQAGEKERARAAKDNIIRMAFDSLTAHRSAPTPQMEDAKALETRFEQDVYRFRNDLAHEDRYRDLLSLNSPDSQADVNSVERIAELMFLLTKTLRLFSRLAFA